MDDEVIPENYRRKTALIGPCHTREEIKAGIVKLANSHEEYKCVPLRQVTCRFGGPAKKLGLSVSSLLSELEAEGRIGIMKLEPLSRTFVFPVAEWMRVLDDSSIDLATYAEALRGHK